MTNNNQTIPQFFLIINGPSCGGKSSVAEAIQSKVKSSFNARQDKIKWLISDYESEKYTEVLQEMMYKMIDTALGHKLSVVKEGLHEGAEKFKQLAEKHNIPIFFANVTAPEEILKLRFQERIEAKKQGAKIGNVSHERFEKLKQQYEDSKVNTPLEFDSSKQSPEEIADEILKYIEKSL